jgi:hypothetical protein
MKRALKILAIFAFAAIVCVSVTGCNLFLNTWTFDNQSSYDITITCDDLTPSRFTVNSHTTKTATSSVYVIEISYNYAGNVTCTPGNNKFTFYNK